MSFKFDLSKPNIYSFCVNRFPFREEVEKILGVENLRSLHALEDKKEVFKRENDQSTKWHQIFYSNHGEGFKSLYLKFIEEVLKPGFGWEKIVYQKIPSFRVHLVNNVAVGEWHRDRNYSHNTNEINVWMPFTDAYDTNTIWSESKEGLEDFRPYDVKYGEFLVFDGANLMHGNKINQTNETRVSVDFRLIDYANYSEQGGASINTNLKFKIGEYYNLI